jgi:hypothetical protein
MLMLLLPVKVFINQLKQKQDTKTKVDVKFPPISFAKLMLAVVYYLFRKVFLVIFKVSDFNSELRLLVFTDCIYSL